MRAALALARAELHGTLASGVPWSVGAAFLLLTGILFWIDARNFADLSAQVSADPVTLQGLNATDAIVQPAVANLGLVGAFLAPLLTMRTLAEERRAGTLELLRALPIGDAAIVGGKYLATLLVAVALLTATLVQPITLSLAGTITASQLAAGYVGAILLVSALVAIGVAISAVSPSQVVAGAVTFGAFVGLVVLDQATDPGAMGVTDQLSPITRLDDFSRGLVSLGSIAYLLLLDAIALTVAWLALTMERRLG